MTVVCILALTFASLVCSVIIAFLTGAPFFVTALSTGAVLMFGGMWYENTATLLSGFFVLTVSALVFTGMAG